MENNLYSLRCTACTNDPFRAKEIINLGILPQETSHICMYTSFFKRGRHYLPFNYIFSLLFMSLLLLVCPTECLVAERVTRVKQKVKYMSQFVKRVSRVIQKAMYHLDRSEIAQPGAMENSKHLMTGPEGYSEFCFPRISMFPETKSRETLRFEGNKIHCSPRDQSFSDLLYSKTEQK